MLVAAVRHGLDIMIQLPPHYQARKQVAVWGRLGEEPP